MGKKVAEGFGTMFGWILGLAFLYGMWWATYFVVDRIYKSDLFAYCLVVFLWIALYAWWYNSHKKKEARAQTRAMVEAFDILRDRFTEVDLYLISEGWERN